MDNAATVEIEERDTSPWAWSREMLGYVFLIGEEFTALNRNVATRISRWLWSTEAIVRRLLLAAAFALDIAPPAAKPGAARKPAAKPSAKSHGERRISFRVFSIRSGAQHEPAAAPDTASPARTERATIGALQLDPLLRIGAELAPKRPSAPRSRTGARKPPISRYDPLYVHNSTDEEDYLYMRYGPYKRDRPGYREPAPRDPDARKRPWYHRHFTPTPDPLQDKTLRPAPGLAARANALLRILKAPEAAALRLAHRLAHRFAQGDRSRFSLTGVPVYKRSHSDRSPAPPGLDEIENAHWSLIQTLPRGRSPDTS